MEPENFSIQIDAAANGYIVRTPMDVQRDYRMPVREFQVFESFDALAAYLRARLPIYPVFSGVTITTTEPPRKR